MQCNGLEDPAQAGRRRATLSRRPLSLTNSSTDRSTYPRSCSRSSKFSARLRCLEPRAEPCHLAPVLPSSSPGNAASPRCRPDDTRGPRLRRREPHLASGGGAGIQNPGRQRQHNHHGSVTPGGLKKSGFCHEGGRYGIKVYLDVKCLSLRVSPGNSTLHLRRNRRRPARQESVVRPSRNGTSVMVPVQQPELCAVSAYAMMLLANSDRTFMPLVSRRQRSGASEGRSHPATPSPEEY